MRRSLKRLPHHQKYALLSNNSRTNPESNVVLRTGQPLKRAEIATTKPHPSQDPRNPERAAVAMTTIRAVVLAATGLEDAEVAGSSAAHLRIGSNSLHSS